MNDTTRSSRRMSKAESDERDRALKNVRELARNFAQNISNRPDFLARVASRNANVYIEKTFQRRRFLFFSYSETEFVQCAHTVVKVLDVPSVYIAIDGEAAGQFAQQFEQGKLHVIDADSFHTQTLVALEKALRTMR